MPAVRVLVVEDEADLCQLLQKFLLRNGYDVETAGSGEEAWDLVRPNSERFSAYLIDLTLPEMSGEELAERIIRVQPLARIVLSSGYEYDTSRWAGRVVFLRKPFVPKELTQALARLLSGESG